MLSFYIFQTEREIYRNVKTIRKVLEDIVERKRTALRNKDEQQVNDGDFLSLLLTDDLFKNDNKRILDETLTFYFAGSLTSSIASQNLLIALIKNPEYKEKILTEID